MPTPRTLNTSSLTALYDAEALRRIERHYAPASSPRLMERAGATGAAKVMQILGGRHGRVLVMCGPGNNGGDGFVLARQLRQTGFDVVVAYQGDEHPQASDAVSAWASWRATGGVTVPRLPRGDFSIVVDALYGIGLTRPIEGEHAAWIDAVNDMDCPVLAIDVPSGLNADTGTVLGRAIRASHTATMIALKPGLLTLDGPDHCGELSVHDLGLDCAAVVQPSGWQVGRGLFDHLLRPRARNSHKGTNGNAVLVGGARGMAGAALLAGRAALKVGAGRVYVGMLDHAALPLDPEQPELMIRTPAEVLAGDLATCVAIGPGLGQSPAALDLMRDAVLSPATLVLDADALNLLSQHADLEKALVDRGAATLLTPHPMEAARLLGSTTAKVQHDRIAAAREMARRFRASVVLKGCGSVLALPDGRWFINTTGNPGMASAGMGDVLTGLIAGLLAQGWPADLALIGGVHLHGLAGDRLVALGKGPNGLTAGEVIESARAAFNALIAGADLQEVGHIHL
ncbi:MAG: bifunctional ADP-dependent NAD(P)H-hydrate dehydratase/NAD(P)H-hydrate epimerase [Pseudomonadota bacterium]|jgi:ADP-dependent NAD(P)H-hydrate dehydratase / NAD(P)H-hydrate epimerase|uniref:bifunctional ADP-dependent NAD(P)H-hydrate dehydratase/NAD(P)H-hydrate epimerase n=1 Tax=Methyloversatilis TaxID=378210 RepID=UPI0003802FB3|nr:bifunctional ADP-dependent NAD(P)H-hydrate dehydratase/NAD(P)H-hydrate epimerase [Methyloversatilis discipulorum]PZU52782.1 MAG: bifunctional ADP-dependent NAD(P)H-hydrate dehydratase/NAD(P)H-hydrate epimerase [Thauera sp.]